MRRPRLIRSTSLKAGISSQLWARALDSAVLSGIRQWLYTGCAEHRVDRYVVIDFDYGVVSSARTILSLRCIYSLMRCAPIMAESVGTAGCVSVSQVRRVADEAWMSSREGRIQRQAYTRLYEYQTRQRLRLAIAGDATPYYRDQIRRILT